MTTNETATLPAPVIGAVLAARSKWECEFETFQRLLPDLLRTHRGKYVVIHRGQLVDSGDNDVALALRFFAQHGNVPIHVGLVTDQPERPVRIPHYRDIRLSGTPV